jgi:Tfp pilus assembly protein PilN
VAQSSTRVSALMRNISASQWLRNPELEVVQTKSDTAGSSFTLDAEQIALPDSGDVTSPKRPHAVAGSTP